MSGAGGWIFRTRSVRDTEDRHQNQQNSRKAALLSLSGGTAQYVYYRRQKGSAGKEGIEEVDGGRGNGCDSGCNWMDGASRHRSVESDAQNRAPQRSTSRFRWYDWRLRRQEICGCLLPLRCKAHTLHLTLPTADARLQSSLAFQDADTAPGVGGGGSAYVSLARRERSMSKRRMSSNWPGKRMSGGSAKSSSATLGGAGRSGFEKSSEKAACRYFGNFHVIGRRASCCARLIILATLRCLRAFVPVSLRGRMAPPSETKRQRSGKLVCEMWASGTSRSGSRSLRTLDKWSSTTCCSRKESSAESRMLGLLGIRRSISVSRLRTYA
mmetsp:Transcript_3414/g.7178  ORF Transcript_3414/g.7178 Transcript_3414/m.7178 type:complete len:326 (-) Transcript_3414:439-1416(-)